MPTPRERKKARLKRAQARQHKAVYLQRNRLKRFRSLRAEIRKRRSNMGRRHKLIARLRAELASGPVTITGNHASGGTQRQRVQAVLKAAAVAHMTGRRKSFYSMSGFWTVERAITGEPRGARSDCSQFQTAVHWSAGGWRAPGHPEFVADPNGTNYTGGYTGTLGQHGVVIGAGSRQSGSMGFYGPYPHHHVEGCVDGGGFIGHGSPPVDAITPGFPNVFRDYFR